MRIESIQLRDHPPIKNVEITDVSNILVLAGPNGVGKTRLVDRLLQVFRSPNTPNASIVVRPTTQAEKTAWGHDSLDTARPDQAQLLLGTLQGKQRRGTWRSSVIYFDSFRELARVQPLTWDWNWANPSEEEVGWDMLFNSFGSRYQDTVHAILKLVAHQRQQLAQRAIDLKRSGETAMPLDFPDPLAPFKQSFARLLAPKTLTDLDVRAQQMRYCVDNTTLPIDSLSSGEREVFKIVFDLLLRSPEDCIIFIDEPEIHLHPELSFRLLRTLETIGQRNQFVLCTHSADIITSALDHTVIFIRPPGTAENQALRINTTDPQIDTLRQLGETVGVVSLGRRIVLIEGREKSVDRYVYGALIREKFPDLVLAPSGGRQTILSFTDVISNVLDKTVWGIDFYMLSDRDASIPDAKLHELETTSCGRLRFLKRYHIENYFLDEETIAELFRDLAGPTDWTCDPAQVNVRLRAIAGDSIGHAVNLWVSMHVRSALGRVDLSLSDGSLGDVEEYVAAIQTRAGEETGRITTRLAPEEIGSQARDYWRRLQTALSDGDAWKVVFPAKVIIGRFCQDARLDKGYFRTAYLNAARRRDLAPFKEILDIFGTWSNACQKKSEPVLAGAH